MVRLSGEQLQAALNGTPNYLGVIIATTTKNNHDTAVPFSNTGNALKAKVLLVQPDAACYVYFGSTNAATAVAASNGIYLAARERLSFVMGSELGWVACVSVSGTTNLKVWELV